MFAQRRRGISSLALIGCECMDGTGGGLGVLLRREKVAGEAGVFEISCRGPEASGSGEVVREDPGARGWTMVSGECK
jgi:hypothetical protein